LNTRLARISGILAIDNDNFLIDERDGKGLADNTDTPRRTFQPSSRTSPSGQIKANGVTRHTLIISNDNDFLATYVEDGHPQGGANPNRWFVFALDDSDLPVYRPQQIETTKNCSEEHRSWDEWYR
jgi:hypothetical protein